MPRWPNSRAGCRTRARGGGRSGPPSTRACRYRFCPRHSTSASPRAARRITRTNCCPPCASSLAGTWRSAHENRSLCRSRCRRPRGGCDDRGSNHDRSKEIAVFFFRKRSKRTTHAPQRIVILGGGFAGVYAALRLEKTLARDPDVEIVLVSRENFLLFTPMLHEVATGELAPA